ncbi:MAG: MFS transporter [Planctomycetota bacterium]
MPPTPALGADRIERTLLLSRLEGMAWAFMVGLGEVFFLPDAIRLGASTVLAALVVSLPLFVGAAGPLLVVGLLKRVRRRKWIVCAAVLGQTGVLVFLAATSTGPLATPMTILIAASVYQFCGQAGGTGWSSWFGDLVRQEVRGRYFASRNRGVHLATLGALLASGLILENLEPGRAGEVVAGELGGTGYRLAFSLAAVFRLISCLLLALSVEPRFQGLSSRDRVFRFLRTARGSDAWRLLASGAALHLVVYIASPFFSPFMIEELQFSYLEYTAATVCVIGAKVFFLPFWGRMVDQHGPRPNYAVVVFLIGLIPLPFFFAHGLGLVVVGQVLSGLSWGGYEVAHFSLLLQSTYKGTRPVVFAALCLVHGAMQAAGALLATPLLALLGGHVRFLFAISMLGRLALALVFPLALPASAGDIPPRRILLQLIGVQPSGGMAQRPLGLGEGKSRDPAERRGE